jgi:hypothetical protein
MEMNEPKDVIPKIRWRKFRQGINCQRVLRAKAVKHPGVKPVLGV